jgi:hypothetical protein
LADASEGVADAVGPEPDLGGVAREFLAQGHGDRVHQVRPARLDHVGELIGLLLEGDDEAVKRGQKP